MNIFLLNEDININVSEYVDAHVNKMITEHTQMLVDVVFTSDPDNYPYWNVFKPFYSKKKEKVTPHHNHPCTVWARQSSGNYEWLYVHFLALGMEYTYRYGKQHASITKLAKPLMQFPKNIHKGDMTPLAQAMPDEYKDDNPIVAYRNYVIHEKHYAQWNKNREKPTWWT